MSYWFVFVLLLQSVVINLKYLKWIRARDLIIGEVRGVGVGVFKREYFLRNF